MEGEGDTCVTKKCLFFSFFLNVKHFVKSTNEELKKKKVLIEHTKL